MARILIAGCGDVGGALGVRLVAAGHEVWGMRRQTEALPEGLRPLAADLADPASYPELPADLSQVFYTAAAGRSDEAGYHRTYVEGQRCLLAALERAGQSPRRLFFTSSTGVYGQVKGEWVDEESATEPASFRGQRMLEAEALLAAAPWPTTTVRLGGIYGPGRRRLIETARQSRRSRHTPPVYTNRIHRDDCAALLHHLMDLERPDSLYVGVDSAPVERFEVISWLRLRLGLPAPEPLLETTVEDPPSPNKRCRNDRLLATGYRFLYPTYREGYREILDELS